MSIEELNSCLGTAERLLTSASIPRRLTACLKVRDDLAMMKAMRKELAVAEKQHKDALRELTELKAKVETQATTMRTQQEQIQAAASGNSWVSPKNAQELETLLAKVNESCLLSDELQPTDIAEAAVRTAKFWCARGPHLTGGDGKKWKNGSWVGTLVNTATESEFMEPKVTTTRFENLLRQKRGDTLLEDPVFYNADDTEGHVKDLHTAYKRRRLEDRPAIQERYRDAGVTVEWPEDT